MGGSQRKITAATEESRHNGELRNVNEITGYCGKIFTTGCQL